SDVCSSDLAALQTRGFMSTMLDALLTKHIIGPDGVERPDRGAIQFKGAVTVEDSPTTGRTIVTVTGGGGGGDVELDGEVTGPASATVVAKVGGADVAFDHEDSGHLTLENGKIVAREPPTPDASAIA